MNKVFFLAVLVFANLFAYCPEAGAKGEPKDEELFFKSNTLIKISLHYIKPKNYNNAEKALNAAYKIARKIKEPYSREIVLFELSDKYLLLNNTENAYKVAKVIEFSDVQSEAFAKIAYKYAELGKYSEASEITKQINNPFSKAKALYKIVNKLTDLELYDQAIKIAKETEDSTAVIKELVSVQILANRLLIEDHDLIFEQYLTNLSHPNGLHRKSSELIEVADRYLELYLFELAKKILVIAATISQRIDSQSIRQDTLQRIEVIRNKISKFEKSLNVAYANKN